MVKKCAEWFESHDPASAKPWFHYCSVNIPHPALLAMGVVRSLRRPSLYSAWRITDEIC